MASLPKNRILIFGNDLAPDFDIAISGLDAGKSTQLFEAVRPLISSVTYEEDEKLAALFTLNLINQPDDTLGKPVDWNAVLDSKAFQEGNFIDLWMGYGGDHKFMGRVETVRWLPDFPGTAPTTFTIKGFDGRHKMIEGNQFKVKQTGKSKKRKTYYKNLPDELVVKKIADKYGYGVDTDPTENKKHVSFTDSGKKQKVYPTRIQASDVADWAFLQRLAAINRFDLWVSYDQKKKKNIIHFKKRMDIGNAEYLFSYNDGDGSLLNATPDFAITGQVTDVEVLSFDRRRRKIERSVISENKRSENVKLTTASPNDLQVKKTVDVGARVRFTAFGQTVEAFSNKPFRSKSEAETFVQNWLKEKERDLIILRGETIGIETLRPRQVHQIKGLSTRIDGLYRFTQIKHSMVPGELYKCSFIAYKVLSQDITRRKPTTEIRTKSTPQQAG